MSQEKKKRISLKDFPYGNEYFPVMSEEQKNPYPKIWTMEKSGLEPPTF